jgi:hypothetical protein
MKLTAVERGWLGRMRTRRCKHGHLRHDARIYRNAGGSLWLDCVQCARDRMDARQRGSLRSTRKRDGAYRVRIGDLSSRVMPQHRVVGAALSRYGMLGRRDRLDRTVPNAFAV